MNEKILVTGGAGYIGSHFVKALLNENKPVVIFDNFSTGHLSTVEKLQKIGEVTLIKGDLLNKSDLKRIFHENKIEAVVHFAAFSQVAESTENPQKYYINNVCGTINLLEAMLEAEVKKIVFSSTAAVYGEPKHIPIDENHPTNPVNPYGRTKLTIENILDDYDKVYDMRSVRLRYFNAAGADSEGLIGEIHNPETHLIPNILKSLFDKEKTFKIFGTDYETKDGTCVRDYINVEDLARAHVSALKYLKNGGKTDAFNLGTNEGSTVKEVFEACEKITGRKINAVITERRPGDPAILIADNTKAKKILKFQIKNNLEKSIETAYNWEKTLQGEG